MTITPMDLDPGGAFLPGTVNFADRITHVRTNTSARPASTRRNPR
ncbi:hypothetical protein [Mycobacterium sp.]|jgi:hypothetical protein|nr:hypothetical protein [Mycobacterium sp.]